MKISTFKYFILDAMKNLKRNVTLTIISIITIHVIFFIVGLFLLYMMLLNKNSEAVFIYDRELITVFKYFKVAVFVGLLPVSLFLIVNQFKMVVFSRRSEISIMKTIGATDWFIRWPFIIQGLVIGIIGALAANLSLLYIYSFIYNKPMEILKEIILVQPILIKETIFWPFLIAGAFIGPIGSIVALRKVLNCAALESK